MPARGRVAATRRPAQKPRPFAQPAAGMVELRAHLEAGARLTPSPGRQWRPSEAVTPSLTLSILVLRHLARLFQTAAGQKYAALGGQVSSGKPPGAQLLARHLQPGLSLCIEPDGFADVLAIERELNGSGRDNLAARFGFSVRRALHHTREHRALDHRRGE